MELMKIELSGYAVLEKVARTMGNTCRLPCPKEWQGRKVKLVLLEEVAVKTPRITKIKEKHPEPEPEKKVQPIHIEPIQNVISQRPIVFHRIK